MQNIAKIFHFGNVNIMSYVYIIPVFLACILGFSTILFLQLGEKKMVDKPFFNEISNELYLLSYSKPFKWFINPNEEDDRVKDIKQLIIEANESHRLNYRVYVTIQTLLIMFALFFLFIFSILANNSVIIFQILFNVKIDVSNPQTMIQLKIIVGILLLSLSIIPKYYLKHKAKRNQIDFLKDFPILQLFIILMLKAKRPLNEVIYVLSTTNTIYRPIFDTAYRIYIRDKYDGMNYLMEAFKYTKFEETIQVLFNYNDYSKKDTMTVLENGLKDITEYTNTLKRRKDIGSNVLSQLSLAMPFLSAILLIFSPILAYGLGLMNL